MHTGHAALHQVTALVETGLARPSAKQLFRAFMLMQFIYILNEIGDDIYLEQYKGIVLFVLF
eukprot:scaffold10969_cov36-Attheya_sp.AAC.5